MEEEYKEEEVAEQLEKEIDIDKLMEYMDAEGKLTKLEEVDPKLWPEGWREVDPNLGRRYMLKLSNFDEGLFKLKEAEIEARLPQREGEDDEAYGYRKRLMLKRIDTMWKPGQSGNPAGMPENFRKRERAKKLPVSVRYALDRALEEEVRVRLEEGGEITSLTKKELIAKNIVDMVALGKVEFPKGRHGTSKRVVELGGRDWATNALKLLKMINPRPMEESEEVVQTISFDIENMMPTNAKMKIVKKITGKDYSNELEYLEDEEAVDGIIDIAIDPEEDDIDISEVVEDGEDEEHTG